MCLNMASKLIAVVKIDPISISHVKIPLNRLFDVRSNEKNMQCQLCICCARGCAKQPQR